MPGKLTVRVPAERRDPRRLVVDRGGLAGLHRNLWQNADRLPGVSRLAVGISTLLHVCILSACAFWPKDLPLAIEDTYSVTLLTAPVMPPPLPASWSEATSETAVERSATNTPFSMDRQGLKSPFWQAVRSAVARNISYPPAAKRQGIEGMAVLRLTVDLDGRLLEAVPVESSADVFAEAALRAVRRAAPFPTLTNDITALSVVLPVRFRLDGLEANHRTP